MVIILGLILLFSFLDTLIAFMEITGAFSVLSTVDL